MKPSSCKTITSENATMTKEDIKELKRKFLDELEAEEHLGIISYACKAVGIGWGKYYYWYDHDDEFRQSVDEITNNQVDFVESKLLANIRKGDTTAIIFYLKTKGRKRGYSEKVPLPDGIAAAGLRHAEQDGDGTSADSGRTQVQSPAREKANTAGRKRISQKVKAKKAYIVKMLKKQGKYAVELTYQVEITAQLLVHADTLAEEVNSPDFNPVTVEKSREGNTRESISAKERLYLETLRQAQRSLAALGMNTDSRQKMEKNDDSFNEFLDKFKE